MVNDFIPSAQTMSDCDTGFWSIIRLSCSGRVSPLHDSRLKPFPAVNTQTLSQRGTGNSFSLCCACYLVSSGFRGPGADKHGVSKTLLVISCLHAYWVIACSVQLDVIYFRSVQ